MLTSPRIFTQTPLRIKTSICWKIHWWSMSVTPRNSPTEVLQVCTNSWFNSWKIIWADMWVFIYFANASYSLQSFWSKPPHKWSFMKCAFVCWVALWQRPLAYDKIGTFGIKLWFSLDFYVNTHSMTRSFSLLNWCCFDSPNSHGPWRESQWHCSMTMLLVARYAQSFLHAGPFAAIMTGDSSISNLLSRGTKTWRCFFASNLNCW